METWHLATVLVGADPHISVVDVPMAPVRHAVRSDWTFYESTDKQHRLTVYGDGTFGLGLTEAWWNDGRLTRVTALGRTPDEAKGHAFALVRAFRETVVANLGAMDAVLACEEQT